MVMMDMRYMWSEIDSTRLISGKRRQPSRGVVFRRSMRWKNGRGVRGGVDTVGREKSRRAVRDVSEYGGRM